MNKDFIAVTVGLTLLTGWTGLLRAEAINVPNGSFESPATNLFVSLNIDSWQKGAKPDWYVEDGKFFLWSQLTGEFKNPAPGSVDRLDNCDGNLAIWLWAIPEVALFQDYDSTDWRPRPPTHAFDARFEIDKSYALTVGVNGGGGGMSNGTTLQISLYYRDRSSNMVTVAATSITNNLENFPNHTHLTDYDVRVPTVRAGDAWAGQHIGILLLSTVDTNLQGGYWDLDNVRLTQAGEPVLRDFIRTNGQFQFTLQSEPGLKFEILASADPALRLADWTSLGTVTNETGLVPFIDTTANSSRRFYRARQLP